MTTAAVSFEFFPPHDEASEGRLWTVIQKLAPLAPRFVSVTYGAGGSTRSRTDRIVRRIRTETALTPAAHITCVGATRTEVDDLIRSWLGDGIDHIVALRGDPPKGATSYAPHPQGYENAADLVRGVTRLGRLDISVAGYPEKHPDSPDLAADMDNLKAKVDAGAVRIITQFFFDNAVFLRFRDRVARAGIDVPVVPGILPITNFAKVLEFSAKCATSVPDSVARQFEGLDADPETRQLVAVIAAVEQCEALRREGVDAFHFYTLNRAELTYAICWRLGLRPAMRAVA
ncbi:MAG: methylenetetrahydrofolate reductase [NAD(P)H] [Alphaproteobacteria bacterium]